MSDGVCQHCGERLRGRQRFYCSYACRNHARARGGPRRAPPAPRPERHPTECGTCWGLEHRRGDVERRGARGNYLGSWYTVGDVCPECGERRVEVEQVTAPTTADERELHGWAWQGGV